MPGIDIQYERFQLDDNNYIAYRQLKGTRGNLFYFINFGSSVLDSARGTSMFAYCDEADIGFTIHDYLGHGESSGKMTECTITDMVDGASKILTGTTEGKQIFVGTNMGSWIMLLTAIMHPERVSAIIAVGPWPDFTSVLHGKLSTVQQEKLERQGVVRFMLPRSDATSVELTLTKRIIDDGVQHYIMNKDEIKVMCPVRIIHSLEDKIVPYRTSLKLMNKIRGNDVQVRLVKNPHLVDKVSLGLIWRSIGDFLPNMEEINKKLLLRCFSMLKLAGKIK